MEGILRYNVFACIAIALVATAGAESMPWVNGGFELGQGTWSIASTNSVADHDGDGDMEASVAACGDGTWQMAIGLSKGVAPGTASIAFEVESGQIDFWDIRVIMADSAEPEAWANNAFAYDPTGTLAPDWFDDQVLSWYSWSTPLSGSVVLDPVDAIAYNIPDWDQMSEAEREARLAGMAYATFVMYACTSSATVDDFGFVP